MERFRRHRIIAVVGSLALVAAACEAATSTDEHEEIPPPRVVATTAIWGDIVESATCDELVEIEWVIPNRTDPRTYFPSVNSAELLDAADLVLATSFDYERELADDLRERRLAGTPVIELARGMELIEGADPTIWLDPERALDAVDQVVESLVSLGVDGEALQECADDYRQELDFLDLDLEAVFAALPEESKVVIADTPELAYFTERYELELVLVDLSRGRLDFLGEVPERIEELLAEVAATQGDEEPERVTVFSDEEPLGELEPAVEVIRLWLHSLLPTDDGGQESYVDTLRSNAQEIALVEIRELE